MRTANFRDDVLWAIAYKLGLDPATQFLSDQADALASYINAWVRRAYDAADHPEWTQVEMFTPDQHIVPWDVLGIFGPMDPPTPVEVLRIGRVFKVYLVDPYTTWMPFDTSFRLTPQGIHCGFQHGNSVWIKFIQPAPRFTAQAWDATNSYAKDDLTYSPTTGQCYKSKVSGNVGNDPALADPAPPAMEMVQEATPESPGLPATAKSLVIKFLPAATGPGLTDPPAAGTGFKVVVYSDPSLSLSSIIATASHTATGTESLATIIANLQTQLVADPDLTTYTITTDATNKTLTLQNLSDFGLYASYAVLATSGVYPLAIQQTSPYVAATAAVTGLAQQSKLTLSDQNVISRATYTVSILDAGGVPHTFSYSAVPTDGKPDILNGLAASFLAASATDPVLSAVTASVDTVGNSITFQSKQPFGFHAIIVPPPPVGSPYWQIVQFPLALVDQVVRGAYADALRESGQTDKAAPEEGAVSAEAKVRTSAESSPQYDPLTDQQAPKSRYAIR